MALTTSLPQFEKNIEARRQSLSERQAEYRYIQQLGLPIAEKYHKRDSGGLPWLRKVLVSIYKSRSNLEAYLETSGKEFTVALPQRSLQELAGYLVNKNLVELLNYHLPDLGRVKDDDGVAKSLDEFKAIFQKEPLPAIANVFTEDWVFGRSFVAGPNPMVLRRLEAPLKNCAINDDHVRKSPHFASDSLFSMISDGRAYYVDYSFLAGMEPGKHFDRTKNIGQPIVVLAVPKGKNSLMPVAIQMGQDPRNDAIFAPADSWSWQMAKLFVQGCDGTYQEVICHLGHTHLVIEPFVIATRRCLAENHPLHVLLEQHFDGTMPINALAFKKLILPGQAVDRLVSANIESVYGLLQRERLNFSFKQRLVPLELQSRGLDDASRLPDHPYRDDASAIWSAIRKWVQDYVEYYYKSDEDVIKDAELAAWCRELSDPNQGAIKDLGDNGVIKTRKDLIDTVSLVIFTSSAQHAAVNFAQKTDMAFCPAYPLASFHTPPRDNTATEQDYLKMLPPIDLALRAEQALVFLGSVQHGRLGHYGLTYFNDRAIIRRMWSFQLELFTIESRITERNKNLPLPYIHLQPSRIPQSINI